MFKSKKQTKKQIVHMRPVSLLRLIAWQLNAILVAVIINGAISYYQHNIMIEDLQDQAKSVRTMYKVCKEIGFDDCKKAWFIIRESK